MTNKPSRLLRCPLVEKWDKEYEMAQWGVWGCAVEPLHDKKLCNDELKTWLSRIEPLLVALVESGQELAHSELWPPLKRDSEAWDAARKAFLEGVEK